MKEFLAKLRRFLLPPRCQTCDQREGSNPEYCSECNDFEANRQTFQF